MYLLMYLKLFPNFLHRIIATRVAFTSLLFYLRVITILSSFLFAPPTFHCLSFCKLINPFEFLFLMTRTLLICLSDFPSLSSLPCDHIYSAILALFYFLPFKILIVPHHSSVIFHSTTEYIINIILILYLPASHVCDLGRSKNIRSPTSIETNYYKLIWSFYIKMNEDYRIFYHLQAMIAIILNIVDV